jgi:hypothetical protein
MAGWVRSDRSGSRSIQADSPDLRQETDRSDSPDYRSWSEEDSTEFALRAPPRRIEG